MLTPIKKENEICCPGCGVVLADEGGSDYENSSNNYGNHILLGTILSKELSPVNWKSPEQYYEEKAWRDLLNLVEKYNLPENFATEIFMYIKKKNHLRSRKAPIKYLIKILSRDDNYLHARRVLSNIKKDYESILNR